MLQEFAGEGIPLLASSVPADSFAPFLNDLLPLIMSKAVSLGPLTTIGVRQKSAQKFCSVSNKNMFLSRSEEILMHSGRPILLCGHNWRNPAGPRECVRRPESGRPTVQSLAPRAGSWSEGQRSRGPQQQRVRTGVSGPGRRTHHCSVSFLTRVCVCFCERGCVSC